MQEVRFSFTQEVGEKSLQCDILVDKDTDPATPFEARARGTVFMTLDAATQVALDALSAVAKAKFLEAAAAIKPAP